MRVNRTAHVTAGGFLAVSFTLLAGLHAYWALGGMWGLAEALGGSERPAPSAWLIWTVAALLMIGAFVVLDRLGLLSGCLPRWMSGLGCWVIVVALVLGAIVNYAASTVWERYCFGPLATLFAVDAALVALGPCRRI